MPREVLLAIGRNGRYFGICNPIENEIFLDELSRELHVDVREVVGFGNPALILGPDGYAHNSRVHGVGIYRHGDSGRHKIWYTRNPTLATGDGIVDAEQKGVSATFLDRVRRDLEQGPYREMFEIETVRIGKSKALEGYVISVLLRHDVDDHGVHSPTEVIFDCPRVGDFIRSFADITIPRDVSATQAVAKELQTRASRLSGLYPGWETGRHDGQIENRATVKLVTPDPYKNQVPEVIRFLVRSISED